MSVTGRERNTNSLSFFAVHKSGKLEPRDFYESFSITVIFSHLFNASQLIIY